MGCLPLVDLCLPLVDLHHFCLCKGCPKTLSAIQPIGMPSAFCIDQIVPGFVVYYLNKKSKSTQKLKPLNPYHFAGQDVSFNACKFLTFFTFLLHFELASIFHQFDTSNFRSAIVDRLSRISQTQVAHIRSRSMISFKNP